MDNGILHQGLEQEIGYRNLFQGAVNLVGYRETITMEKLLYMSRASMYPLQTYIQQLTVDITQITDAEQLRQMASMSSRSFNATKIVVSTIPLLIIYPFLQKYFVSGIVIGAVKE